MIPLEVVVRGVAAGSLVKRRPGIQRGALLIPRMIEFFLKDDANHDPLIDADTIVAQGIASPAEVATMGEIARITFEILAHAWRRRDTLLVDLKIEFGRIASGEGKGQLVIADVIDNDSWRIWPQGREDLMLDKQQYRNLEVVTPADLDRVRANYETVAEIVGTFPQMRPGMVALISDGPDHAETIDLVGRALGAYGLPSVRHIVSVTRTPGYVLQLVAQQLDATFARMVYVRIGTADGGSRCHRDATAPVVDARRRGSARGRGRAALREGVRARGHRRVRTRPARANQRALGGVAGRRATQRARRRRSTGRTVDRATLTSARSPSGIALSDDELRRIAEHLERLPTDTELFAFDAQWSEHCSYKSRANTSASCRPPAPACCWASARTPGSCGSANGRARRYGVVIAHESHNHPSQVVPFEGAATGVGGIVRDVLCMGAEVIGIADPLRFGRLDDPHCRYVAQGVVDGIAAYGNAIGVPNVGGDVFFDESFDDNVLVNVVALGPRQGEGDHPLARACRQRSAGTSCWSGRRPIAAASAAPRSRR